MIEAGQFLSKPGAALTFLSGFSIVGLVLLCWTLWTARRKYVSRLVPAITDEAFIKAIGLGGVVSIVLTLVLQTLSMVFLDVTVEVTGAAANQVSQISPGARGITRTVIHRGVPAAVRSIGKNPGAKRAATVVAVIAILLLVVGAGYSFTAIDLSFFPHFIAFTVGIGLVEECTKAIAGVIICYWVVPQAPDDAPKGHRRRVMAAFGLAGLGFGAGEALHYFGVYNDLGGGIGIYAVRSTWCVALHACWTMISGAIIASSLPALWDKSVDLGKIGGIILAACIPSMILHGFYDAACIHESRLSWITGIVSIIAALGVFESTVGDEASQAASAQVQ